MRTGKRKPSTYPADEAVNLLRERRLLIPFRHQQAGLVRETADDPNLARMHRVFQDIVTRNVGSDLSTAINSMLDKIAYARAEYLAGHWGKKEDTWEVWPLLEFANRQTKDVSPTNISASRLCREYAQAYWSLRRS